MRFFDPQNTVAISSSTGKPAARDAIVVPAITIASTTSDTASTATSVSGDSRVQMPATTPALNAA